MVFNNISDINLNTHEFYLEFYAFLFFLTMTHCIISYLVILSPVLVREKYLHNMAIISLSIATITSS